MKAQKFIAIATAAAFAFTGTCYADTEIGDNLATEGSDVTEVIEDISLMGDRIETDEDAYYTGDLTVNFSLYDETGISKVAIVVDDKTIAEKSYDAADSIETADGEVMNADSTIETEGEAAASNTSEPLTTVSDSLTIKAEDLVSEDEDAKATEPADKPASEETAADADATVDTDENADVETDAEVPTDADAVTDDTAVDTTAEKPADGNEDAEKTADEATVAAASTDETAAAEEPAVTDSTIKAQMVVTDVNGETETKDFEFKAIVEETTETTDAAATDDAAVTDAEATDDTAALTSEEIAEEGEAILTAKGLGDIQVVDKTTYKVEVNLTCQTCTVFKKNSDGTYKPIRVSVCSTGKSNPTPTGTWTIGPYKKKCGRSRWALMSSGKSYAQYLVRFRHGICFHSVIYNKRGDNSKMYRKEYNKLGSVASAGCVRLRAIDAKWIYDHCPDGTKVRVYKSSVASPLGVPTYKKLTTSAKYSWDPTDPDTGNPFNGGNGKATGIYIAFDDGYPVITLDPNLANHNIQLSTAKYTYDGKSHKPSVKIYGLTKDTNYTVTYPSGRKKVGTYGVTVKGIGSFTGSKNVYFTIVPKSTKIKSLKRSGSKKFKVKYKKVSSQISGYEIMYSKSSNFSNSKTVKVNSYKKTSKTVKTGVKGTHYVKVRVYKTVNGKKYYSNWSSKKKVKVK